MYDMKPDQVGWTVFDVETGQPALLNGLILIEFEYEDADELVARLNRPPSRRAKAPEQLARAATSKPPAG